MEVKHLRDTLVIGWMKFFPEIKRQPFLLVIVNMVVAIPLFFVMVFGRPEMMAYGVLGTIVSSVSLLSVLAAIQDLTWDRYC